MVWKLISGCSLVWDFYYGCFGAFFQFWVVPKIEEMLPKFL
ncbi:uncharacterized protein M6B38_168685 [Iris pallida]|uniref:Uncharacterized protein n=1 Tax=Iris pallida TaxID=29817 RepID=A0AAX6EVR2_IRIPA|nr:uncharacterized protein M6B38_168685 [Iris pallida]